MSCDTETFQMIQKVFQLQDEREHVLKLFEEGYKIYMSNETTLNLQKFRQLVMDITKDFKRISLHFDEIAKKFNHNGNNIISKLIKNLQELEEYRLHYCAKLQMAKQEIKDNPERLNNNLLLNKISNLNELYNNSILLVNDCMKKLRLETDKITY